MQTLSLYFHFFFAFAAFLVMFGAKKASQLDKVNHNPVYWLIGISMMCIGFILFGLTPYYPDLFVTISTVTFIFSNIAIALLLHSWRGRLSKVSLYVFWISYIISLLLYEAFRKDFDLNARIYFVSSVLAIICLWSLIEIIKYTYKHNFRSLNLFALSFIFGIQTCAYLYRIYISIEVSTGPIVIGALYQEPLYGAITRLLAVGLCLIVYILIANIFLERLWIYEQINSKTAESTMLQSLNALAMARDNETGNHLVRTQNYVKKLALRLRGMGHYTNELSDEAIEILFKAAPLHDIGKVGIPDNILHKLGHLNDEEWQVMQSHAAIGEAVLSSPDIEVGGDQGLLKKAIQIAGGHHEKWDGTGYPRGLKGEEIPLPARIMAIADVYDALVSERVYKSGWSHEDAVKEIVSKKGIHFDPLVVDALIAEQSNFQEIANKYRDN
ncbi:HD domain-containing protein [Polynucleobacter sp. MWH-Mekk-B1]|uniref:HD-GYP domain-containing protein n=1 Tax=Polynucleobacter finlandensis TaxID=1855894 RepID=UPI001C0B2A44|nr:HD domain-containing phosphohydrolase [Polynucleobacter finlandensis]MBU3544304.1 HD domain-containing protein [Polynucleobacter finlandensis]